MLLIINKDLKAQNILKHVKFAEKVWKTLFNYLNYGKVRDHCHYAGKYRIPAHSICNLKFNVLNEIPFYNGSKYEYHFLIKEFANKCEGPFKCIGENSKICKSFSVPIKKEVIKTNKYGKKSAKTVLYKFYSIRFISNSLTHHVDKCWIFNENVVAKTVNLSVSLKELKITNFFLILKSVEKNS